MARSSNKMLYLTVGILSLLPLICFWHFFKKFYWFGDEWDLLTQIETQGVMSWSISLFAENFVPLYKLLWAGLLFIGDGSYMVMLEGVWITHALNAAILCALCVHIGIRPVISLIVTLFFALSGTNIESLVWSVQWSAVLSMFFFLAALLVAAKNYSLSGSLIATLLCLGSGLSFSRGVMSGITLGILSLVGVNAKNTKQRLLFCSIFLLPSLIVAALISSLSSGNHQKLLSLEWSTVREMIAFASVYFFGNPLVSFFPIEKWSVATIVISGILKVGIIAWVLLLLFREDKDRSRLFIALGFFLFDIGNAALLGLGRYHTGLDAAMSSRYQYAALISFVPFVGLLLERIYKNLSNIFYERLLTAGLFATSLLMLVSWQNELPGWVHWRGTSIRRLIRDTSSKEAPTTNFIEIPWISIEKARQLKDRFHLK